MDIKRLGLSEELIKTALEINEASCAKKVEEKVGDDSVDKDVKLKRAGAKGLSVLDKLKGIKQGFDAARKGESEDELKLYNKSKSTVKEEVEELDEAESPTKGTRKVASYGDHSHTAEVRYNPEYQEYSVHHYKDGKHQGEGPVSYHYDDKQDAHDTAKHSVGIKEEVEQIDEISKATLGSYISQAARAVRSNTSLEKSFERHADNHLVKADKHNWNGPHGTYQPKDTEDSQREKAARDISNEFGHTARKRLKGIDTATKKLTKEELNLEDFSIEEIQEFIMSEDFEQLDELSKGTLKDYISKAHDQLMKHTGTVNMKYGRGDKDAVAYALDPEAVRKTANRTQGVKTALNKLTKEQVEELDELDKKTLGSYVKKAADDYSQRNDRISRALDKDLRSFDHPNVKKAIAKQDNRKAGMHKAIDKLTKEQVEEIETLAAKHGLGE